MSTLLYGKVKCKSYTVVKTKHKELWGFFPRGNYFMLLVPIIAEVVIISLKNNTHTQKQMIEKMCSRTECFLVSPDILKHREGLRRNGGSDGF